MDGKIRNVVAEETKIEGTVRTFSKESLELIEDTINQMNRGLEIAYNCEIECNCLNLYPPVVNDEELYNRFAKIQKESYIEIKQPLMLAEDFSYYQKVIPGIFFFVGTKTETFNSGLHTGSFNFDETVLEKAIDVYCEIITRL